MNSTVKSVEELIDEALAITERFWFIQATHIVERTERTITIHFRISSTLFVQAFFSERSQRLHFALVGSVGRLYGRDREQGVWHRHPFGEVEEHEPTPEGMSAQSLTEFMTEVEELLLIHDLI